MTKREIRGIAISAWWVLVIIVPICTIVLWVAVDHANHAQDQAQHRSNQQFRKALLVTDRKFQQALRVSSAQFAYSINKSVCGFRDLAKGTLKGAVSGAHDPRLPPAIQQRNQQIIRRTTAFLSTQVTIPSDFNCSSLPKTAPKPKATP